MQLGQVIFDPSITLGTIINSIALLVGFAIAFTKIGGRIDLLALRLQAVEVTLSDSKLLDKRLIAVEERLVTAQRDVSDLKLDGYIAASKLRAKARAATDNV